MYIVHIIEIILLQRLLYLILSTRIYLSAYHKNIYTIFLYKGIQIIE